MITKLKIAPCTLDAKGNVTGAKTTQAFVVRLNPANFTRNFDIQYNTTQAMGASSLQPKYASASERKIEFEFLMDGTGVVPPTSPTSLGISVKSQLDDLKKVVFTLVGQDHEPNTVMLIWGDFSFCGKLCSMSVDYTLFKPTGEPLRAKVKLCFLQYVGPKEAAKKDNLSSPDLTHSVEVKAGDTLPLICHRIYKDSAYYMEIARINGITNFRDIKPGMRLNFPPLR